MEEKIAWKIVSKKIKKIVKTNKNSIDENDSIDEDTLMDQHQDNESPIQDENTSGNEIYLPFKYILWCHDIFNKDWSLNGYNKLCEITTVTDFWKLFNNLEKLGFKINNFFLMRDGTDPTWEHENNRNGGICSMRIEIENSLKIYEELCSYLMCNKLVEDIADINGISISPKNNWAIIKIWNRNKNNDLSKLLNETLLDKYKDFSIKYKENEPEY